MTYPTPTAAQVEAAIKAHEVNYVVAPLLAKSRGRLWSQGFRAIINHHTAGSNSLGYLQNKGGQYPLVNALIQKDGKVQILTFLSCWGTGEGGPWTGVCGKNSLHLVGWSTEIESMGKVKDFTPAQMESRGRLHAALLSLGIPAQNEINHKGWASCVNGVPQDIPGRKTDTLYPIADLRANTALYKKKPPNPEPDPVPRPPVVIRNGDDMFVAEVQYEDNNKSFWLVGSNGTVNLGADDALTWTGPRVKINDKATWLRILAGYPPVKV